MGRVGLSELIVILVILLLLFGASRLPEIAKAVGKSIKEFKKGINGEDDNDKKENKL